MQAAEKSNLYSEYLQITNCFLISLTFFKLKLRCKFKYNLNR